ncbi:MAG: hypothetical protein QXN68_00505 [Thermoplasmata archaeon]
MMNIRTKKQKSKRLQEYVVNLILKTYPELTEDDVRSTYSSVPGPDILLSSRAKQLFPFDVECKNHERINLYKFWEQLKKRSSGTELPLLVVKSNHKEVLFVMDEKTFIYLLTKEVQKNDAGKNS